MNILPPKSIFLAGVPATGKTYFGDWLEKNYNYLHLDIENKESVINHNLLNEVGEFRNGNYESLFYKFKEFEKPIILNYGFPPEYLSLIKNFFNYGLVPVWFDAKRNVSCEKFLERGGIDIKYFNIQMDKIEKYKIELNNAFGKCTIQTLRDNGTRVSPEDIYNNIKQILAN